MEDWTEKAGADLKAALTRTKSLLYVAATGAGAGLLPPLWGPTGASRYLVGFCFPYSKADQTAFLGREPDCAHVSPEMALDLAMESYIRASEHRVVEGSDGEPVGLGLTCAVASDRMPRGEQRAHVAVVTRTQVRRYWIPLVKEVGGEARRRHDSEISRFAIDFLLANLESVSHQPAARREAVERFYKYPVFHTDGTRLTADQRSVPAVYLPATLNPITDGHRAMCAAAEEYLGSFPGSVRVTYLVSTLSPHKGRLGLQDMLFRAGMLRAERWRRDYRAIEFTDSEPLFVDKARNRPGSTFVIGADAMERMLDPSWGYDPEPMLLEMKNLGIRFLVMGRVRGDGRWQTCDDIKMPFLHRDMFVNLPGRVDISSSELRVGPERGDIKKVVGVP